VNVAPSPVAPTTPTWRWSTGPASPAISARTVSVAAMPVPSRASACGRYARFAYDWVATAPTSASAAGTAAPAARNLLATATPSAVPSAERATIENVMPRP
jgi:hypothetical protein